MSARRSAAEALFTLAALLTPTPAPADYIYCSEDFPAEQSIRLPKEISSDKPLIIPLNNSCEGPLSLRLLIEKSSRPAPLLIELTNSEGSTLNISVEALKKDSYQLETPYYHSTLTLDNYSCSGDYTPSSPFHFNGDMLLSLDILSAPSTPLSLCSGDKQIFTDHSAEVARFLSIPVAEISIASAGDATLSRMILAYDESEPAAITHTPETLSRHLDASTDKYEGYWALLDYSADDTLLRPGGEYEFAIIGNEKEGYEIIYVSGAEKNPGNWQFGCIKATLAPTHIPGTYRCGWKDADGRKIDDNATLIFDNQRLASVQFPSLTSQLRLHRILRPSR